jgi:hypothetical protein
MALKINTGALEALRNKTEAEKKKSRASAVLQKKEDPSWIILMDNINMSFDTFQGIRGYFNIITGAFIVMMSDVAQAHRLLRENTEEIECVKIHSSVDSEAKHWVAFEISNRAEIVTVRSEYYGDRDLVELTPEKKGAIEYRITVDVLPMVRSCLHDRYPYHERPRILSNIESLDTERLNEAYTSGEYYSPCNGSFLNLVYRLKGMSPLESVLEFEEWLGE